MNIFSRGQKGKLAELGCASTFAVVVDIHARGADVDVSCFGLDATDTLSDDRYMVFFNQLASPRNAITLAIDASAARFSIDLNAVPDTISKLVFTASIDGAATMRNIDPGAITVGDAIRFPFSGDDFSEEKAVIIAELYRRDGLWRFGAVGQGFNGGLSALLKHFGGAETGAAPATSAPVPVPPPNAPVEPKKVSLSKITLEKNGQKVSLEKRGSRGYGRIHVNLNWNRTALGSASPKSGFFNRLTGSMSKGIDLDLACLYELSDGTPGLVQALGNNWGDYDYEPFICLEGDDRTGSLSTGENMFINGDAFDEIKRVLIFAFIYEGVPNWSATDGVVTINVPDQAPVEVKLDRGGHEVLCAIAMIENRNGTLQVTRLVDYISSKGMMTVHEVLDRKYGFGLRWVAGSKD
jgi:tellurite resistance protein TerA